MLKKSCFSHLPTPATMSPSRPEAFKTASLPRDASFPMLRSRLESILNVAHSESKLSWQLGRVDSPRCVSCRLLAGDDWQDGPKRLAAEFRHQTRLHTRIGTGEETDNFHKRPF